jgi:hypothetical protein
MFNLYLNPRLSVLSNSLSTTYVGNVAVASDTWHHHSMITSACHHMLVLVHTNVGGELGESL